MLPIWVSFLLITTLLTLSTWGVIVWAGKYGKLLYGEPFAMILYVIGGNSPPIAAFICWAIYKTHEGTCSALKYCFKVKDHWTKYVLALFFLVLHFVLPAVLGCISVIDSFWIGLVAFPIMIIGGGLEEIGWRGLLIPAWAEIMPFYLSNLILAPVWSLWHLPLFFFKGTVQFGTSFWYFCLTVTGTSFSLGALRQITDNTWICILYHAYVNSFYLSFKIEHKWYLVFAPLVQVIISITLVHFIKPKKEMEAIEFGQKE